jgi:hypothetical protein
MNSQVFSRRLMVSAAILIGLSSYALAGPPLICHRIEIGQAKTIPLIDWNQETTVGYDLNNLTRDTLAILDSNASVLVRMETLRRATIYARHDPQVAKALLTRLLARAANGEGGSPGEALAWFDVGYLAEAYKQWMVQDGPNPASEIDGYAWVKKAIGQHPGDAEMEFAAALITLKGPEADHREHVKKAMAGANNNPLLAQNLASEFHDQTISKLLTSSPAGVF